MHFDFSTNITNQYWKIVADIEQTQSNQSHVIVFNITYKINEKQYYIFDDDLTPIHKYVLGPASLLACKVPPSVQTNICLV